MPKFEVVSRFKDSDIDLIPKRGTKYSAGYDMVAAEDTLVMPYNGNRAMLLQDSLNQSLEQSLDIEVVAIKKVMTLDQMADLTKKTGAKPTLVSTGVKCYLDDSQYLKLVSRSSSPLKYWLTLANNVGIIDQDYYNNPDNEGHIFLQLINLSPYPILIPKGEAIGQGIISPYLTTENDSASGKRIGGFGSTNG